LTYKIDIRKTIRAIRWGEFYLLATAVVVMVMVMMAVVAIAAPGMQLDTRHQVAHTNHHNLRLPLHWSFLFRFDLCR
jgi:heme/copper-type cytochrome/quinol oxidase subunit 2